MQEETKPEEIQGRQPERPEPRSFQITEEEAEVILKRLWAGGEW